MPEELIVIMVVVLTVMSLFVTKIRGSKPKNTCSDPGFIIPKKRYDEITEIEKQLLESRKSAVNSYIDRFKNR